MIIDNEGREIDKGGAPAAATAVVDREGTDGVATETDPEDPNAQPEPAGAADPDGGAADPEAPEAAGAEEAAASEETPDPEPALPEERLKEFQEQILEKIDERLKAQAPPAPEMTDAEWNRVEQEWGGVPRPAIERTTRMVTHVYQKLKGEFEERLSKFEKNFAMESLGKEKGFEDVPRLRAGIDEFLSDFDPKHHSNPALLKKAAVYARGLAAKSNVQRVRTEAEKGRKVVTGARPAAPSAPKGSASPLTSQERSVIQATGISEAEYRKNRKAVID